MYIITLNTQVSIDFNTFLEKLIYITHLVCVVRIVFQLEIYKLLNIHLINQVS